MPRERDTIRLFVAVYPPPEVAARLLGLLAPLHLPPHRATPPGQVHLTLQFVGETRRRDLKAAAESVERSCAGLAACTLVVSRLATVPDSPPTAPPRLVAAFTDTPPTLLELHRRLAQRFAHHRKPERPDRYTPHLTLCRFPEGTRRPAGAPWRVSLEGSLPGFPISEVRLMASHLRQTGAVHESVAVAPLAQ